MALKHWLMIKEVEHLNLDDPATTIIHQRIIADKPFLSKLYQSFYSEVKGLLDCEKKKTLEIGSGAGFSQQVIPDTIRTDILDLPKIDMRCSALMLPVKDNSVDGIFMLNVLHHVPDVAVFFKEAQRCLATSAKIVMIEPANTLLSRFIFKYFHHETFDPSAGWTLDPGKPLSGANGALPWIVFNRDRGNFEKSFPHLKIKSIRLHTPFSYLLSGGVSMKQLVPGWSFSFIRFIEWLLTPLFPLIAMFQTIELVKEK